MSTLAGEPGKIARDASIFVHPIRYLAHLSIYLSLSQPDYRRFIICDRDSSTCRKVLETRGILPEDCLE
jgi:hypothetical protein